MDFDASALGGGAIFNGGTLTLKNDTFSLNQAAAANGGGGNGGAIYNTKDATLNVSLASVFKINSATNAGGAIYSSGTLNCTAVSIFTNNAANGAGLAIGSGTVNLKNAQIYNDTATQDGGGIYETGGKVTVSGATGGKISGDKASNGGGIFVYSGSLTLKNGVQVFNNEASGGDGGGIFLDTKARASITGGGSVFGNTAMSGNGGGIYNGGGTLTIGGGEQIKGANEAMLGGGIYLAVGSTTTFNTVTVQGNKATLGQGIGIYQQTNNSGQAKVINNGLTDNDDPGGKPFQGP